ncbi:MAG: hypothetical protein HQL87_09070 [Magnetococcales bacterium]|nr:hypothetical protein [Magnetococcales bacterium]
MRTIELYQSDTKKTAFLWTESLRTGHDTIDRQHQEIYEALLGVSQLLNLPEVHVAYWLGLVQRKMEDYLLTHFQEEERLMVAVGYPDLEKHRLHHLDFIESFQKQKSAVLQLQTDAERLAGANRLLDFLHDWFNVEILSNDKDLAHFIQNKK